MVKLIRSSVLSARMVPPWSSTISLAMAKPRPAPPVRVARELSRRKNCSKIRSNFSWGMFFPALEKVSTIFPASIRQAISTVLSGRL